MAAAAMSNSAALDSFLDKWRSRWPEWRVAEAFVPPAQRELAVAWFALLQEFEDAMNIAGDPTPADAKLGWWGEELRDWSRRRSRHPLGRALEPRPAPWFELAEALPALVRLRERPHDMMSAFATVQPLAEAMVAVEDGVLDRAGKPESPVLRAQAIACQLLASRLFAAGDGAVPQEAAERPGAGQAWAQVLLAQWPPHAGEATPRRLWAALARSRLQRFEPGAQGVRPLSNLRLLWLAWRAARA